MTNKNNKPLHIMFLGLRGIPDVQGGIETHVEHITPFLVKQGCSITIISRSPYQPDIPNGIWNGVVI